jgi:hypothetical protein
VPQPPPVVHSGGMKWTSYCDALHCEYAFLGEFGPIQQRHLSSHQLNPGPTGRREHQLLAQYQPILSAITTVVVLTWEWLLGRCV